ncbi:MAG: hypothetical protein AAFX06_01565 [Planctomycetota bacterium]
MMQLTIQSETKPLEMEDMGDGEFWRIHLDGDEIATNAGPFTASSREIVLEECGYCYHCGAATIAARKIANHTVIWFTNPEHELELDKRKEPIRTFKLTDYEAVLGSSSRELPPLSEKELRYIFSIEATPLWDDFLYTLPELTGDDTGTSTLGVIAKSVVSGELTPHIAKPSHYQSVTFGFDIDHLHETTVDFGIVDDEIAFRFRQRPAVPIWLQLEKPCRELDAIKKHLDAHEEQL